MNERTNMPLSTAPVKRHPVRHAQRPARKEFDAANSAANPSFGLLVGQLVVAAQPSSSPGIRAGENPEQAGSAPVARTSAASPGAQVPEEGAKGETTATQSPELPPNESDAQKESAGPVIWENEFPGTTDKASTETDITITPHVPDSVTEVNTVPRETVGQALLETMSPDTTDKADEAPDDAAAPLSSRPPLIKRGNEQAALSRSLPENGDADKTTPVDKDDFSGSQFFDRSAGAGEDRHDARQVDAGGRITPEGGAERQGTAPFAAGPDMTESASLVMREAVAVHPQAGIAAAERAFVVPEAGRYVHPRAADFADMAERSVSIVRNGNHLAVQFEPDGIGKLDLDLRLDKGVVNAQIHVADESTRSLIENNMRQILDALLKEGLNVGGFSVALKKNDTGDAENSRWQGETRNRNGPRPAGAETTRFAARGIVSIFV